MFEDVKFANFDKICRFCLEKFGLLNAYLFSENDAVRDAFTSDNNYGYESIPEMVKYCTGVDISPRDNLPPFMCTQCLEELLKCNRFRRQCLRSGEILNETLLKHLSELAEAADAYDVIAENLEKGYIDDELFLGADELDDLITKSGTSVQIKQFQLREIEESALSADVAVNSVDGRQIEITEKGPILNDKEKNDNGTELDSVFSVDLFQPSQMQKSERAHCDIVPETVGTIYFSNCGSRKINANDIEVETVSLEDNFQSGQTLPTFVKEKKIRRKIGKRKRLFSTVRRTKCQICGLLKIDMKTHMSTKHAAPETTDRNNDDLEAIETHDIEAKNNRLEDLLEKDILMYGDLRTTDSNNSELELIQAYDIEVETERLEDNFQSGKTVASIKEKKTKRSKKRKKLFTRKKIKLPAHKCRICGVLRKRLNVHMLFKHGTLVTTDRNNGDLEAIETHDNEAKNNRLEDLLEKDMLMHGDLRTTDSNNSELELIQTYDIEVETERLEDNFQSGKTVASIKEKTKRSKKRKKVKLPEYLMEHRKTSCYLNECHVCYVCRMRFPNKSEIDRHLRIRHPVVCYVCNKRFKYLRAYENHQKKYHPLLNSTEMEKGPKIRISYPVICDACNKRFKYLKAYKTHQKKYHPLLNSTEMIKGPKIRIECRM